MDVMGLCDSGTSLKKYIALKDFRKRGGKGETVL